MRDREKLIYTCQCGWHKGFYNDDDVMETLCNIGYTDFFEYPNDDEFPYDSAHQLLCGSCQIFALALNKVLGYSPYIIQGNNKKSFHAFCQIYKDMNWYYVDARGITSSFDEFMNVARGLVSDEFNIRLVTAEDIEEWKKDGYSDEAMAFAKVVIEKYKECYML